MSSDSTATTVAGAGPPSGKSAAESLRLVWIFPQPTTSPANLSGQGEDADELLIGRDTSCAIPLSGKDVSRRHAALRRGKFGARTTLVDLGSRNGVRVNGAQISCVEIGLGDVVRVGGWVGVVANVPADFGELAPGLFGGAALAGALAPLRQAARSELPIVLQGETGTGKEVVARSLHTWSGRPGPMVGVNCAALPETLAEGELFGYRRGAFTGADKASPGLFRSAQGGTLLLDEVSDLSLPLQAKLLRVLEEREVQPLGEIRPVPIDVRIVVAGQQSLMTEVAAGRFRPDLLARLDGLTVVLPPLRQHRQDIPLLFAQFLQAASHGRAPALESDLVERLCLYDWPFNVRELVLLVRRLCTLHADESTLLVRHLPERMQGQEAPRERPATSIDSVDLPALVVALRTAGGNVARASAMLGITRQRAYRLMEGQAVDLDALRAEGEPQR